MDDGDVIRTQNTRTNSVSRFLKPEAEFKEKKRKKKQNKTEMAMIHAVGCGTNTVISLQRKIPY